MSIEKDLLRVCGTTDRLDLLLRGGDVVRYHTEGRQIQQQTVAEHTWRVLVILLHLWPDAFREMILVTLYHDVAEGFTGDLHAVLKMDTEIAELMTVLETHFHDHVNVPMDIDLDYLDSIRLKCADILEVIFTVEQQNTKAAKSILDRAAGILVKYAEELPEEESKRVLGLAGLWGEKVEGKSYA